MAGVVVFKEQRHFSERRLYFFVAGLNHTIHSEDMQPHNGYDKNGKKINDNGGNTTDYMYDDNGKVISSTSVKTTFSNFP